MEFTCTTMSLCRGTQEIEAILGQGWEGQEPLARLRLAIDNEEKMVCKITSTIFENRRKWCVKKLDKTEALSWRVCKSGRGHLLGSHNK